MELSALNVSPPGVIRKIAMPERGAREKVPRQILESQHCQRGPPRLQRAVRSSGTRPDGDFQICSRIWLDCNVAGAAPARRSAPAKRPRASHSRPVAQEATALTGRLVASGAAAGRGVPTGKSPARGGSAPRSKVGFATKRWVPAFTTVPAAVFAEPRSSDSLLPSAAHAISPVSPV